MLFEEVLARLESLSIDNLDVKENKIEVEDLVNISPCLHTDNYLTYSIFLGLRKDLSLEEIEAYKGLINALKTKEKNEMNNQYKRFETAVYK